MAGFPLGVWGEEIAHSWLVFEVAGVQVNHASQTDGKVALDGYHDLRNAKGGAAHDRVRQEFLNRADLSARLLDSTPVGRISAADYDAILRLGVSGPR